MSGPDNRAPGQFVVDNLISNSLELTPKDYYAGLSVWDAYRVSLFVHMVRRASEGLNWEYAVMAYGSTTRFRDRSRARDIDLKVLNTAGNKESSEAVSGIRESIRGHYQRLRMPFQEYDRTFKWDSVHSYKAFGGQISNEDPSFVIHSLPDAPGLPLHVSIAGNFNLPALEKIGLMRSGIGRSFAVLLEPSPAQALD